MKPFIKKHSRVLLALIIVLLMLLSATAFSLFALKLANHYVNNRDYSKAIKLYNLSLLSSLNLNARAEIRLESAQAEIARLTKLKEPASATIPLQISPEQITVKGKRTSSFYNSNLQHIVLSALLQNNLETGIPTIKVKKINLYDKGHHLVAVKTSNDNLGPLVSKGQIPFSLYFLLDKDKQITVSDFDLELEIPPFYKNSKVIRLVISDQKILSRETTSNGEYAYTYLMTILNPSDKEVEKIYRISFLKEGDWVLNRANTACCTDVAFTEPRNVDGVLSLDDPTQIYSLKANESRAYQFRIITDELLVDNSLNPTKIELVIYFIGSIK